MSAIHDEVGGISEQQLAPAVDAPVGQFFGRRRNRVLIVSQDRVGPQMAGPGIRYWEFAQFLSQEFDVTLAAPAGSCTPPAPIQSLIFQDGEAKVLRQAADSADVVIAGGYLLLAFPFFLGLECPLVIDAYVPYPLEALELQAHHPIADQVSAHAQTILTLNLQFLAGDFFLCASERQRDLWLGNLLALGRLDPQTYFQDRSLRHIIDVIPFGLPAVPPRHENPILRGVHPSVGQSDKVVLWGGGIWQWLDPLTLIRAMAKIRSERSDVRLFFPGTRHPDAGAVPDMPMRRAAERLCDELGLTGHTVIFGDWVPYQDRQNYLLEADLGVSLHFDIVETRFAFRTRLLDYVWAGLPIVATEGDPLGDLVRDRGLGRLVQAQDVDGLARTLCELLGDEGLRSRLAPAFRQARDELTWPAVLEPLARFCRDPRRSASRDTVATRIYSSWIGDLQERSRAGLRVQEEATKAFVQAQHEHIGSLQQQVAHQEEHVRALHEQITGLQERARSQDAAIEQLSRSLSARIGSALRGLRGARS